MAQGGTIARRDEAMRMEGRDFFSPPAVVETHEKWTKSCNPCPYEPLPPMEQPGTYDSQAEFEAAKVMNEKDIYER